MDGSEAESYVYQKVMCTVASGGVVVQKKTFWPPLRTIDDIIVAARRGGGGRSEYAFRIGKTDRFAWEQALMPKLQAKYTDAPGDDPIGGASALKRKAAVYSKLVQSAARAMALGRWDLVSQRATEIQPR